MSMTNHPDDEELALYVEQLLSSARKAKVEEHLKSCDTCYRSVVLGRELRDAEAAGILAEIDKGLIESFRKRVRKRWRALFKLLPSGQIQRLRLGGTPISRPETALYWSNANELASFLAKPVPSWSNENKPPSIRPLLLQDAPGSPELSSEGSVLRMRFSKQKPSIVKIHVSNRSYEQRIPDSGEVRFENIPCGNFEIEIIF